MIWLVLGLFFFHRMYDWRTFFWTKWWHLDEGTIWTSLAHRECKITWVYSFWSIFIENISVVKPTNLSGFMSRLYAEQCILLSDYGCRNWIFTPTSLLHTTLVKSQQKSVPLLPKGNILFTVLKRSHFNLLKLFEVCTVCGYFGGFFFTMTQLSWLTTAASTNSHAIAWTEKNAKRSSYNR